MPDRQQEPVTAAEIGDDATHRQLFASLYAQLRGIARRELRRTGSGLTLGATTLLHEAYLNLDKRDGILFPDAERFLTYASRAMRGLIIDYVRCRQAQKRGGAFHITSLSAEVPEHAADSAELQRLGDAVDKLAEVAPRLAQLVDLKYFGGFSFGDIAAMCNMSERTVQRDWEKARLFLYRALSERDDLDDAHTVAPVPNGREL